MTDSMAKLTGFIWQMIDDDRVVLSRIIFQPVKRSSILSPFYHFCIESHFHRTQACLSHYSWSCHWRASLTSAPLMCSTTFLSDLASNISFYTLTLLHWTVLIFKPHTQKWNGRYSIELNMTGDGGYWNCLTKDSKPRRHDTATNR